MDVQSSQWVWLTLYPPLGSPSRQKLALWQPPLGMSLWPEAVFFLSVFVHVYVCVCKTIYKETVSITEVLSLLSLYSVHVHGVW